MKSRISKEWNHLFEKNKKMYAYVHFWKTSVQLQSNFNYRDKNLFTGYHMCHLSLLTTIYKQKKVALGIGDKIIQKFKFYISGVTII